MSKGTTYRTQQAEFEQAYLSEYAAKSFETKGRRRLEPPCDIRTEYQRDRDRIIHSKAFRRLKHKTQVFISPQGDHYRTRMTHALEVSQIARTITRTLRLNEDLTEAIALGHDLGHTPFGHWGEDVLDELLKDEGGFVHNKQSIRVVETLEDLNLTIETKDGIEKHKGNMLYFRPDSPEPTPDEHPLTLEGQIVKIADRIAYLNHDIEDAIRAGIILDSQLPPDITNYLGKTKSNRITFIVKDIIAHSTDSIKVSAGTFEAMAALRDWLFKNVYRNPSVETEKHKVKGVIVGLYWYYLDNFDKITDAGIKRLNDNKTRLVGDYIAGMTDRFAVADYLDKFIPKSWKD